MRRLLAAAAAVLVTAGCGDISRLTVQLRFPDPQTDASTKKLMFVVRTLPPSGNPCDALWGATPANVAEKAWLLDYPNAVDLMAAPVDTGTYTVLVYAYPSALDRTCQNDNECTSSRVGPRCRDIGGGQKGCMPENAAIRPMAGACAAGTVRDLEPFTLVMTLEKAPARAAAGPGLGG